MSSIKRNGGGLGSRRPDVSRYVSVAAVGFSCSNADLFPLTFVLFAAGSNGAVARGVVGPEGGRLLTHQSQFLCLSKTFY